MFGSKTQRLAVGLACAIALLTPTARGEMRIQDMARLQGQRTNKLFGFGLVVGLPGTGDANKNERAKRALISLHKNFHQPVFDIQELSNVNNATIVSVEATIPEFGAREGETIDVVVSAIGSVKSLKGGQLLTTPLQYAALDPTDPQTQEIYALAGGRIEITDKDALTRGVIRNGATLEADFFYNFVEDGHVWLVLDESKAGYPWAQAVARVINRELANPVGPDGQRRNGRIIANMDYAVAVSPKTVRVEIPAAEVAKPANFIQRVLQITLFDPPEQAARVVINRTSKNISFTGAVTISPTVLQIPSLGAITVGATGADAGNKGVVGVDTTKSGSVAFQELLQTLTRLQVSPDDMITAIEHLYRTGTLNAQLVYSE